MDQSRRRIVRVIGHKNPDTDSICSAISYAYLKNQLSDTPHEPRRAGDISRETEFVLNTFGVEKPRLSVDASPTIGNIDIRTEAGIDQEMSLYDAWQRMMSHDIDTLCIVEPDPEKPDREKLLGLITIKDIANANLDLFDAEILSTAKTSCKNLVAVLQGRLLCGDPDAVIEKGKLGIGTSPEVMDGFLSPGDLVIVTNRYETQMCAIDNNVGYLIISTGAEISDAMLNRAREKGISVISTDLDTFAAARLIGMAAPVRTFMQTHNLNVFNEHTPVEEAKRVMASTRHRYFPIIDKAGHYIGVISRRNLLNLTRKKFILVDHNEKNQAIDGLDEADVLEIIDHHRIGNLETGLPVFFRNEPVGCTATIVYTIFREKQVEIPKHIAGLLLSAILSDTLLFHSPTCTLIDRNAAEDLAKIAEVDIDTYGQQLFEAGEDLTGRDAEDILYTDFKEFALGGYRVSVGQAFYMSEKSLAKAAEMVSEILPSVPDRAGVDLVFCLLTDIRRQGSLALYAGSEAGEILNEAFPQGLANDAGNQVQDMESITELPGEASAGAAHYENSSICRNGRFLPDVVSRKKQFIPAIRERLLERRTEVW